MAGGAGTRFWPLSRRARPKQLLPIASERTMLQDTVARIAPLVPPARIVVVTGHEHAAAVRQQLPLLPARNILVEPIGRNTAPCIALAAEWIHRQEPDSAMAVLPADHAIRNPAGFRRTVRRAFAVAEQANALVTLGVLPTRPETGYGYIKTGVAADRGRPQLSWVAEFREKPDARRARRLVASGRYLWNAGIFVWRTAVIRAALERHLPALAAAVAKLTARWPRSGGSIRLAAYRQLPSVSIDVGVMEPAAAAPAHGTRVAVVAADFGWSDVGSWAALAELWGHDGAGNAVRGNAVLVDTTATTVYGDKRLVALLGVHDLVVVDTPDALLICPAARAQEVRAVVAKLERQGQRRLL
ncbi:MAG: mannose-1-phosphate guanylyltransferase [Deltaproteobacteria bacterium]|nr:mannose-1-phosphate guanylyltransferase [Deltaproteobacteria bacterium]